MSAPVHPQPLPHRRAVLTAAWGAATLLALAGSPLLNGCRSGTPAVATAPPPTPTPDEVLRRRAVTQVRTLLAAVAVPGARPTLRPVLGRLGTGYQEQLVALGEPVPTPSGSGTDTAPSASSGTATTAVTPAAAAPTAAALVAVQRAATAEALTDCAVAAAPGMAVLLARLAAAHAAEADLVSAAARLPQPGPVTPAPSAGGPRNESATGQASSTSTGPASSTGAESALATSPSPVALALGPEQVAALTRLLQGEHAAIYAYGVVTAWVAPSLRGRARTCWAAHVSSRDDLVRLLTAASASAPAASAGYDIGRPPGGSAAATALAAKVEERLAALAAAAVGATADAARMAAAGVLVASARRQAGWTTALPALPG